MFRRVDGNGTDSSFLRSSFDSPSGRSVFQSLFERAQEQMESVADATNPLKKLPSYGDNDILESLSPELLMHTLSFVETPDLYRLAEVNRNMTSLLMLRTSCNKEDCEFEICKEQPFKDRIWKEQIKKTFSGRLKKKYILEHVKRNWDSISLAYSSETKILMERYFDNPSSFNIESELKKIHNIARVAKDMFLLKKDLNGIRSMRTLPNPFLPAIMASLGGLSGSVTSNIALAVLYNGINRQDN